MKKFSMMLLCVVISGCGTISILDNVGKNVDKAKKKGAPSTICTRSIGEYYSATQEDIKEIGECPNAPWVGWLACIGAPFYVIDIPISLAVDTFIAPFTFIRNNTYETVYRDSHGNECEVDPKPKSFNAYILDLYSR